MALARDSKSVSRKGERCFRTRQVTKKKRSDKTRRRRRDMLGSLACLFTTLKCRRVSEKRDSALPCSYGIGCGEQVIPPETSTKQDKAKEVIKNALKATNLSKCLHDFFGDGTILTKKNSPRLDASEALQGGHVGETRPWEVPDTGRATIHIDSRTFSNLAANDTFLTDTYLHETANALAIQRFTNIFPRGVRARMGPRGRYPTERQWRNRDPDIGHQFEICLHKKD